jgi:hypothetical protein
MSSEDVGDRLFEELQELVAMEVKDILATAAEEGFTERDTVNALELALQAEIEALADGAEVSTESVKAQPQTAPGL